MIVMEIMLLQISAKAHKRKGDTSMCFIQNNSPTMLIVSWQIQNIIMQNKQAMKLAASEMLCETELLNFLYEAA